MIFKYLAEINKNDKIIVSIVKSPFKTAWGNSTSFEKIKDRKIQFYSLRGEIFHPK
jgi:hypothetical protein